MDGQPVGSAAKLVEAFQEVEQLLRTRSTARQESKETALGEGVPALQRATTIQPMPLNKVRSAPTLPRPRQAVVEMDDSDDEEVRKAKCEKGPKRSVALKIAARRVLDSDPPELPMAKHKVQGLHGLEHYELVNIGALQSSCELLGESVTVDTMLQHRRQRELKDRLKRSEPEKKRWPDTSASRSLSWEERQEQVMMRRQQRRQEEAYRRLAATRQVRKLCRGGGSINDAMAHQFVPQVSEGLEE